MHMNTLLIPKWSVLATSIRTSLLSLCFTVSSPCVYPLLDAQKCLFIDRNGRHATVFSLETQLPLMKVKESSFLYLGCVRTFYASPIYNLFQKAVSWGSSHVFVLKSSLKSILPFVSISSLFAIKITTSGVGLRLAGARCPTFDCEMLLLFPVLPCLISSCVFSS